jgi:hypothetical protein
MRKILVVVGAVALGIACFTLPGEARIKGPAATMLSHDVYFTLKDNSPKEKAALVALCKKYLTGHDGEVFFGAGVLAADLKREVNDLKFDVALHIVFKDMAAHDKYQDAPRHLEFIKEGKANWKEVRVFDSYISK